MKRRYGIISCDIKVHHGIIPILYIPIFFGLRGLYISLILALYQSPLDEPIMGQFWIYVSLIIIVMLHMVFLIKVRPYEDYRLNRLQIFNESMIYINYICFRFFAFTNDEFDSYYLSFE